MASEWGKSPQPKEAIMTTTEWVPEDGWEKAGDWTDDYDEHPDLDLGLDDSFWESR